jgi:hypothetical protein
LSNQKNVKKAPVMLSKAFNTAKYPTLKSKKTVFAHRYPTVYTMILCFFFRMYMAKHNALTISPYPLVQTKGLLLGFPDLFLGEEI